MSDIRRPAPLDSELRVVRLLSIGAAVVAAATVVTDLALVDQPDAVAMPTWFRATIIAVTGSPILIGLLAPTSGTRTLRRLNGVAAISHAVVLAALWPALGLFGAGRPVGQVPWVLSVAALAMISAVIAWGQIGGLIVLVTITLLMLGARTTLGDVTPVSIVNDHQTVLTALVIGVFCAALLATSRELDASAASAAAVATRQASDRAHRAALVRTQALVHDDVLATLVFAAQNSDLVRAVVAEQARKVRSLIRDLAAGDGADRMLTADAFSANVARLTTEVDASTRFRHQAATSVAGSTPSSGTTSDGRATAYITPDAASTLLGALRQALVNSVHHAGPCSTRTVTLTTDASTRRMRIVIADDGRGFDADTLPDERMGISASILARLKTLPGGAARVESRPGAGTVVVLDWVDTLDSTGIPGIPDAPGPGTRRGGGVGAGPAAGPLTAQESALPDRNHRSFVRGVRVAFVVFLLIQPELALNAAQNSTTPWLSLLTLAGVWLSVVTLGWRSIRRPSVLRGALTVAVVATTAALMLVLAPPQSMNYWDSWYLTSLALVLFAVALRGRLLLALAGLAALTLITVAGVAGQLYAVADLAISVARPVAIVSVGGAFAITTALLRAKIRSVRADSLRIVQQEAYESVTRCELQNGARELEAQIGPMLDRLEQLAGTGPLLSRAESLECRALEGLLRDRYRGGRLAAEPVTGAARAARRRGIDVVLLDDSTCDKLPPAELTAVLEWMARLLDDARDGAVVGRMLPTGREGIASVVSNGTATLFRGCRATEPTAALPRFEA